MIATIYKIHICAMSISFFLSCLVTYFYAFIFMHYRRSKVAANMGHRGSNQDNPSTVTEHHNRARAPVDHIRLVAREHPHHPRLPAFYGDKSLTATTLAAVSRYVSANAQARMDLNNFRRDVYIAYIS